MRRRRAPIVLLALLAPATVDGARPADLDAAIRALDELRYEEAATLLERAWRSGDNDRDSLALLFRLQGEVAVTLGQDHVARAAFTRLLALDSGASLPDGISPKIVSAFEAAREELSGRRAIAIQHSVTTRGAPAIVVTVTSDPLGMIAGARARFRGTGGVVGLVERRGGARIELPLPAEGRYHVTLAAIDSYGNRLVEIAETPIVVGLDRPATPAPVPVAPPPVDVETGPPFHLHPITWGVLAVAFAGSGLYFSLRSVELQEDLYALNEDSGNHPFTEAQTVEENLRLHATLANVSFVASGACVIVTTVLLLRDGDRGRARARPTANARGGGFSLELRF